MAAVAATNMRAPRFIAVAQWRVGVEVLRRVKCGFGGFWLERVDHERWRCCWLGRCWRCLVIDCSGWPLLRRRRVVLDAVFHVAMLAGEETTTPETISRLTLTGSGTALRAASTMSPAALNSP